MVFTPTEFTESVWGQVLTPKWIIPLALALWLLLFLWGPLAKFFRRLNAALEDKTQKIEQSTKVEEESEEESAQEEDGEKDGEGAGGEGTGEDQAELSPEEEEDMKKF